ncbi:MAG TPA: PilT/PilU family type 4a pilus ATPase, partial [Tepidisphaeraceae bacterium]|nr:PilT/PilU family type 4a pilus ATPase [Tepidisphaeraceae bacterium]
MTGVRARMIEEILAKAISLGASDVHIRAGQPALFRIHTEIVSSGLPPLGSEATQEMARRLMGEERWKEFLVRRDADFSIQTTSSGRFRVNAHFQRGAVALAIRTVSPRVRMLKELYLPETIEKFTHLPRGLVLVTGPAGSGKSTTLAAMAEEINRREARHIITLEDPIEYELTSDRCYIEQREVGADVPDFAAGLRHALRQDPDVILLGEMRDLETISAAITSAETGHLVLSTLHTVNAAQTIERIVDVYPSGQQGQVRSMVAGTLQAVVSQTLLKRSDEPGMIPAVEIMICTPAVRNCIRENRIFEIPSIIETSRAVGMQSLD